MTGGQMLVVALLLALPRPLLAQEADLDSVAVRLTDQVTRERFDSVVMRWDSTMTALFPQAKLEAFWTQVVSQAGPFQERLGVRRDRAGGYRRVFVTTRFSGAILDFLWVFDGADRVSGFFVRPGKAPQDSAGAGAEAGAGYIDPLRFDEWDLSIGDAPWRLPATLTRPRVGGLVPAVVLVHGSGPNDRDESIGPNKPFRDLAQGLASQGIAVLRYDKRTLAHRDSLAAHMGTFTVDDETVDDAVAALAAVRHLEGIDPRRVFVAGHSLGAMMAPRIASRDPDVAGVILLAAPARGLEVLIVEQIDYLVGLDGDTSEAERVKLEEVGQLVERIRRLRPADAGNPALIFGAPAGYWLDLRDYDPVATAASLDAPMLIMSGGRDYQVTGTDDDRWRAALAGHDRVTFDRYPELNHLFIAGTGAPNPAEYQVPGHVAAAVVADIAAWVRGQTPRS